MRTLVLFSGRQWVAELLSLRPDVSRFGRRAERTDHGVAQRQERGNVVDRGPRQSYLVHLLGVLTVFLRDVVEEDVQQPGAVRIHLVVVCGREVDVVPSVPLP